MKRITIDPITRLEGHGKIEIFLNDEGNVENAYLQIPELRGFEQFSISSLLLSSRKSAKCSTRLSIVLITPYTSTPLVVLTLYSVQILLRENAISWV